MANSAPSLPGTMRAFNGLFTITGPIGENLISLRPDKLMRKASREAGLDDFGSDYFYDPLTRLCRSLEQDAKLTALGRLIARQDLLRLLQNRLRFVEIFKRHPEIAEEEIREPIFILGMPRTGTTSLHELMALDPQFRVPLSWEVAHPFPPSRNHQLPKRPSYSTG